MVESQTKTHMFIGTKPERVLDEMYAIEDIGRPIPRKIMRGMAILGIRFWLLIFTVPGVIFALAIILWVFDKAFRTGVSQ
jgi:hypothetical protein